MERALDAGVFAKGALKLELINAREKIAHVGDVCGHMVFCAGIKISFAARDGRRNALIFQAQDPTRLCCSRRA